jgi:hypothetical protein
MAAHAFVCEEMVTQLRALAHAGHNGINIARVLNERFGTKLSPLSVRTKCVALGISLRPRKAKRELRFSADEFTWQYFNKEAFRRGMTLARFCGLLMRMAAADDLAGAVVDDAPRPSGVHFAHQNERAATAALADHLMAAHPEKRNGVARP